MAPCQLTIAIKLIHHFHVDEARPIVTGADRFHVVRIDRLQTVEVIAAFRKGLKSL